MRFGQQVTGANRMHSQSTGVRQGRDASPQAKRCRSMQAQARRSPRHSHRRQRRLVARKGLFRESTRVNHIRRRRWHAHELHGGVDHGTEDAVEDAVADAADEGVDANGGAADCASPPDAEPSPVEAAAHQQAGLTDAWKNVFKR